MDSVTQVVVSGLLALLGALFSTEVPFAPMLDSAEAWQWFAGFAVRDTLVRAIVAAPVAYFAQRKGYSWWGFFLVAMVLMPAAVAAVLVALPRGRAGAQRSLGNPKRGGQKSR
ncbi:hypothetical protein [Adlercreutzia aquisgranensis]|uniref:hypothetical protein n=1 Tax=Adlercreutzia aquisgranensis TaxID=2941323 RepID=UPI0020411CD0|nr:hypothetical protein [Adlercreutzia aquisgranensis]